ncbi:MAG: hypothetical protein GKS06_13630 [Acidobacteria bacterium]|nr:hypothetical protein [Acidobacteriota bacterium]
MQFKPGRMMAATLLLAMVLGFIHAAAFADQEPVETKTVFLDVEGMT